MCEALLFHHYSYDKAARVLVTFDLPPLLQPVEVLSKYDFYNIFVMQSSLCTTFHEFKKIARKNYKSDNLFVCNLPFVSQLLTISNTSDF